jgi:ubiquinone/menaquinone biosynthesis C-methylase UbiE
MQSSAENVISFGSLPPVEQARQLARPEGQIGIQVAAWLNANNRDGIARILGLLEVRAGEHVLEIGFGNGRATSEVLGQAAGVQYEGIDFSPTMVEEARRFNAALVDAGRARFHLASAERMPFADAQFDRVFSIGVIHFWQDALASLREVHRVMRAGGLAVMGALDARCAPAFARPEFGFYLRSAGEWSALWRQAGFQAVQARAVASEQVTEQGAPIRRYSIRLVARR